MPINHGTSKVILLNYDQREIKSIDIWKISYNVLTLFEKYINFCIGELS